MLDKDTLLKIFAVLPEEKLMKALSVVGLGMGSDMSGGMDDAKDPAEFDAVDAMGANKLQSWNDRTVQYDGGKDRPAMADKDWAIPKTKAAFPDAADGEDLVGGDDNFLQTGGV